MRLLLLLALAGCTSPKPAPDAAADFGGPCMSDGNAPLSACTVNDGEVGWCVNETCYRGCINGMCDHGGTPIPIYNDCYCK